MTFRETLRLICPFLLGLVLCDPQCQTRVIYGAVNGTVILPVKVSVPFQGILWKKEQYPVIYCDVHTDSDPVTSLPCVNRISLDTESGNLSISNLTHSDEGEYELTSPDIKGNIKFRLEVIDPLPPVTLNCTWTGDTITIQCGLEEPDLPHADLLRYSWLCSGAPCPNDTRASEMYLEKNRPPEEVTCVVRNPLSERKSLMDAVTCVPDGSRSRWSLPLTVLVVVPVLAAVGYYIYTKTSRSVSAAPVAGTEDEELQCVTIIYPPPS